MPGPYAVRIRTPDGWQDIAMAGPPGPLGPPGPNGTVVVYEQPNAPASPVVGSVWIDTDDQPPTTVSFSEAIVTSLPSSPVDGQIINYLADATNGIAWRLRYRTAASGSYKWESVGGSPLEAQVDNSSQPNVSSFSYVDFPSFPGPSIVVPLAGEYLIDMFSWTYQAAGGGIWLGVQVGATAPQSADTIGGSTPDAHYIHVAGRRKYTVPSAGTTVKMVGRSQSVLSSSGQRTLSIQPVRVG